MWSLFVLLLFGGTLAIAGQSSGRRGEDATVTDKKTFIDGLVSNMTVEDLGSSISISLS